MSDFNVQPFLSLVLPVLLKEGSTEDDLIEFRMLLEIAGIQLVIKNADSNIDQLNELKEILNEMEQKIDDADAVQGLMLSSTAYCFLCQTTKCLLRFWSI